ncbi:hypothetical protein [Nonomuraea sp. NPDC003709]|uniref:hypothetical protein n=1 Tax=Nonomuraea sp. NPDC003709 TaxID=3154450 RepID=UPI0033AA0D5F
MTTTFAFLGLLPRINRDKEIEILVVRHQLMVLAPAGKSVHAVQAACEYSWRTPPSPSLRRMSKAAIRPGSLIRSVLANSVMVFVLQQAAVEEFAVAGLNPSPHDRVHTWHPNPGEHGLDAGLGKDFVYEGWEPARSR